MKKTTDSLPDRLVWKPDPSGNFSFKSAWNLIRKSSPKFAWNDLVWFPNYTPRNSLVVWKLAHRRLATADRLIRFDIGVDPNCILCWAARENINHLFFECSFSSSIFQAIWGLIAYKRRRGTSWEKEGRWTIKTSQANSGLGTLKKLAFSAIIAHIWRERNFRKFQNTSRTKEMIINNIIWEIKTKLEDCESPSICSKENLFLARQWQLACGWKLNHVVLVSWCKPEKGWCSLNTDGSAAQYRSGTGGLIRDYNGIPILAFAGAAPPCSVIEAEASALLEGVKIAIKMQIGKIWIQLDSKLLVGWINGTSKYPWSVMHIVEKILCLLPFFVEWKCSHVYREANRPADWLASSMESFGSRCISPSEMTDFLITLVEEDRSETLFPREISL